jgi:hypothetical protein
MRKVRMQARGGAFFWHWFNLTDPDREVWVGPFATSDAAFSNALASPRGYPILAGEPEG